MVTINILKTLKIQSWFFHVLLLIGYGFVGIGIIAERAKPIREVIVRGKPLLSCSLACANMADNAESNDLCEYVAPVRWIASVERGQAKWKAKAGLYTTTHVRASLEGQAATIDFLEAEFNVNVKSLVA